MAKVAVLLAPGFEEAEAIITIDILVVCRLRWRRWPVRDPVR